MTLNDLKWLLIGTITANHRILGVPYFWKTPIVMHATDAEERAFDAAGDIDAACVVRPPRMISWLERTF